MKLAGYALIVLYSIAGMNSAMAQGRDGFDPLIKQSGFIEDLLPVPFHTVSEALVAIPKLPHMDVPDRMFASRGLLMYDIDGAPYYYMVFLPSSEYYPSVVRRRLVLDGNHLEIHTSMLCGASVTECAHLRVRFQTTDNKCGSQVPTCPGHISVGKYKRIPPELMQFLPEVLAGPGLEHGGPFDLIARASVRRMRVTSACQDVLGGKAKYEEAKNATIDLAVRISNGDRARALPSVEAASRKIEGEHLNKKLADEFTEASVPLGNQREICAAVENDLDDRIHELKQALRM